MKYLYFLLTLFFISSCQTTIKENNSECKIDKQNEFVYDYMQNHYLWYKQMPKVNYLDYDSPFALLKALKVSKDKWSFIMSKEALDAYYAGLGYIGFGFKLKYLNNKLYITLVYPNSPASEANLARGNQIISINGKSVEGKDYSFINSVLGNDQKGVEGIFEIIDNQGNKKSITMYKKQIKSPSVLKKEILNVDGESVGYLLFDKFIEPSSNELKEAFKYFKANNVSKLIIDLRYNGGGLVNVANDLVSLIVGKNYSDEVSFKLIFNDKNSFKNKNYYIKHLENSLNINDVYFLTTKNTCSASEAVINALSPYGVNVHIVGSKTCGKPVGMVGKDYCDFYLIPIEFKIANSNNEGDYFEGLNPNCQANDDIKHDFGDENEGMLNQAIYLMQNGECLTTNNRKIFKNRENEQELSGENLLKGGAF